MGDVGGDALMRVFWGIAIVALLSMGSCTYFAFT